ncbi:lytic murein transglycosylase [Nitratifractor salsuginis]|uniref:Membrane-bound lytic murein transglycosylase n=1 Tax=Nitratifractor salsuginis (strain DSM 16511 / JCM 12458 / E9I37-1) TaxID=749222 RepID=E6X397_NITSE|nr:lytic murein transglycosylase [Nitratifractor salsuginis]ADV47310.1 membrane-bound lytic murein transglycosylase [Nitratifractor salsuginis DSM 16511]
MMKKSTHYPLRTTHFFPFSLLLLLLFTLPSPARIDYSRLPAARAFAERMHQRYGFDEGELLGLLKRARHQAETLARYRGRHKVGATDYSWHRYKSRILVDESVRLGVKFMSRYRRWLSLASRRYRVAPKIITAFIRVESKFGRYGHEYPVWDSLVTLAFNPNRKQKFFRGELEKLLILARKNRLDPLKLRGSFAGAMGCAQQVPSIQLRYGVDLDGDGRKDPDSIADCIGTIANFLHRNGWKNNRKTLVRARHRGEGFLRLRSGYRSLYPLATLRRYGVTPAELFGGKSAYYLRLRDGRKWDLFLGDRNYRIITLYNASKRYGVTIALYAEALRCRH